MNPYELELFEKYGVLRVDKNQFRVKTCDCKDTLTLRAKVKYGLIFKHTRTAYFCGCCYKELSLVQDAVFEYEAKEDKE